MAGFCVARVCQRQLGFLVMYVIANARFVCYMSQYIDRENVLSFHLHFCNVIALPLTRLVTADAPIISASALTLRRFSKQHHHPNSLRPWYSKVSCGLHALVIINGMRLCLLWVSWHHGILGNEITDIPAQQA